MLNTPVPKKRSRKREKPGPPTPGRPTREMMEQMKGEFDTNAIAKLRDLMKNNGKAEDGDDSCSADGNHVFAGVTVVDDAQVGDRRRLGRIIKKAYFRAIWGEEPDRPFRAKKNNFFNKCVKIKTKKPTHFLFPLCRSQSFFHDREICGQAVDLERT